MPLLLHALRTTLAPGLKLGLGVNSGALLYHLGLFAVFYGVYSLIDFGKHYALPADQTDRPDWVTRLYFTGVVQYAVSTPGEMAPITPLGRTLTWMHITASIVQALALVAFSLPGK
jgi:hypothetical protein